MVTKVLAGVFAAFAVSTVGYVGAFGGTNNARPDCCAPGADCCYPGSPCCDGNCCPDGPCCPGPCCNDAKVTAKKATVCTDGSCCPDGPCCPGSCCETK